MASFEPIDFDPDAPPARPTTPPVRRGFLIVLAVFLAMAGLVYGIPFVAGRAGYAYEAGRSRAAIEALEQLDKKGILAEASSLFRLATTAAAPAVVHISVYKPIPEDAGGALNPPAAPPGVRPGMFRFGTGSGVVIDKEKGYVVTNAHVLREAEAIGVRFGRSDEIMATLVGADPKTDLAVIRVPGLLRAEARWGDPDALDIGDWVLAIGSPFELDQTVTAGIISATGRSHLRLVGSDSYEDFLQTDAAINPGNSGGPLVNLKGEVVGINTAILTEKGSNQGIGLAISARLARRVVEAIIKDGKVNRGYLGVIIGDLTGAEAARLGLPDARGALIREVEPGSPADRSGLGPGDVVSALDEKAVGDANDFRNRIAVLPIGAEVAIDYVRDGQPASARVRIEPLPTRLVLGMTIRDLGGPIAERYADRPKTATLIVRVDPAGAAGRAGIVAGLRIVAVGEAPVARLADLDAILAAHDPTRPIPLKVQAADGQVHEVTIIEH